MKLDRYDITRKPRSTSDIIGRFAANLGQDGDSCSSISVRGEYPITDSKGKRVYGYRLVSYNTQVAFMSTNGLRLWISTKTWSSTTAGQIAKLQYAAHKAGFNETINAVRVHVGLRYYSGEAEFVEYRRTAKSRDEAISAYAKSLDDQRAKDRSARMVASANPRLPKLRGTNNGAHIVSNDDGPWYKVLAESGVACHGGMKPDGSPFVYPLPQDGEVGKWMPYEPARLCISGYHVTKNPEKWYGDMPGYATWEVEVKGHGVCSRNDSKASFSSIRLIKRVK